MVNRRPSPGFVVQLAFAVLMLALFARPSLATDSEVAIVAVPDGGRAMSAKTDKQGMIHLVYDTDSGPHYIRYDASKPGWVIDPVPLVDEKSRKPGLEFITWDMAVTSDGTVHVALGNNAWKLKLPQEEWGFFYARLLPSEKSFSPLKNINHQPSEGFSIAVDDHETVTAVWMADKLYANVSRDGGNTFSKSVEIDSSLDPCNCCTTSSVYGADGRLAILYREETHNERDMYLAIWNQEQNKVTKSRISSTPWKTDSCPMTYYSIVRNGDGFIAAWPTKGDIYFAKLDGNGSPLNPREIKTPGKNGMRSGILPVAAKDGSTLMVWKKDDQTGFQRYDQSGRPTGSSGSMKSAGKGVAGVLSKNNEVILFQ